MFVFELGRMDKRLFFLNEVCSSYGAWVVVHKEMVARLCCQAATLLLHLSNTVGCAHVFCVVCIMAF